MSNAIQTTFGETKMSRRIATPLDITSIVKAVTTLPTDLEAIAGDVVQLVNYQQGYKLGHYYQRISGKWIDIGEVSTEGLTCGSGSVGFDLSEGKHLLTFKWTDPDGKTGCNWVKSEIIMCTLDDDKIIGETALLISNNKNAYRDTGYNLTRLITQEEYESKVFYVRSWFENGCYKENVLTNNGTIIDS